MNRASSELGIFYVTAVGISSQQIAINPKCLSAIPSKHCMSPHTCALIFTEILPTILTRKLFLLRDVSHFYTLLIGLTILHCLDSNHFVFVSPPPPPFFPPFKETTVLLKPASRINSGRPIVKSTKDLNIDISNKRICLLLYSTTSLGLNCDLHVFVATCFSF